MFLRVARSGAAKRIATCKNSFSLGGKRDLNVGVIGLGNMGGHMAANIAKALPTGTFCYDIKRENVDKIEGAQFMSVAELSSKSDVIITMLPNTSFVQGACLGTEGVFANAKKGSVYIDCSTIDPIASKELALKAKEEFGIDMLDAPVSGGVTGAQNGTLTFMVGGQESALKIAEPVLNMMGKNIVYCGSVVGSGEVAKLCNNLALAISMIGTCEAMSLGKKLGMDPKILASVMNSSTARCWSSDTYNPYPGVTPSSPANNNYNGGFGTALMEKDLTLAMDAAQSVKARLPLGSSAHQLYGLLCEHGYSEKDFSIVYEFLSANRKQN